MALLRQLQPLISIMALGIGLGLISNSFSAIPTSGSALFGFGATILAGATMGLIGGGGSILTVPILVYLLGIPPVLATGYSLFVVGLSALVGSVNYFKLGLVNLKAGTIFAIPAFVGVFLARKFLVPALPLEIFTVGSLVVGRDLIVMGVFATVMILASVSMSLPPDYWIPSGSFQEILYHKSEEGIAKITINRPHVRNAFTPLTVREMQKALDDARDDINIGTIILTGQGDLAFCSGGDQKIRGDAGYKDQDTGHLRLNVLDFQRQIRTCPKPIVAMVAGYAIGGGHVLHLMCDLTIAAKNGVFGQTGPKVGSFDGGFGSSYLARIVGQKKAREIWFLCRQYNAQQALEMGLVNTVVPLEQLEEETVAWCRQMLQHSPTALRCLKAAMNADCDGQAGLQELAGAATLLFYQTEEGQEGRNAYVEKRPPDFGKFVRHP